MDAGRLAITVAAALVLYGAYALADAAFETRPIRRAPGWYRDPPAGPFVE